jgi:hypothetical protein
MDKKGLKETYDIKQLTEINNLEDEEMTQQKEEERKLEQENEEPEAVDLMMETESLSKLNGFYNERIYVIVSRYLCSCTQYAADTEEMI